MNIVIFYEKPGCSTNDKQKQILRAAGCSVISRDLLDNGLNKSELRAFFGRLPVHTWFNPNAPKVKSGAIKPEEISEAAALSLFMIEPLLIKRPLIVVKNQKLCGFNQRLLGKLLQLPLQSKVVENCTSNYEPCS